MVPGTSAMVTEMNDSIVDRHFEDGEQINIEEVLQYSNVTVTDIPLMESLKSGLLLESFRKSIESAENPYQGPPSEQHQPRVDTKKKTASSKRVATKSSDKR